MMPGSTLCLACEDRTDGSFVACDHCDKWTHYHCAKLDQRKVDQILNYYCDKCTTKFRFTTWILRDPPTAKQLRDKNKGFYHDVKSIVNMREADDTRYFQIQWKYSPVRTWEPEKNLDGCPDLLQNFLVSRGKELSQIKGFVGADTSKSAKVNISNWHTIEDIIQIFRSEASLLKIELGSLSVASWTSGCLVKDGIYFMDCDQHCYVLLYEHDKELAIIADGQNLYRDNDDTATFIRNIVGVRLISIKYSGQIGLDHCSSSAILIALELAKCYTANYRPLELMPIKSLRDRIISRLHPHESESLHSDTGIACGSSLRALRKSLICNKCGKAFSYGARRNYAQHIRRCQPTI